MLLYQKHKPYYQSFSAFLKSKENFAYFDKNDGADRFCNFEITDSKNVFRKMSKELRFRELFNKQHDKRAEALFKSASQHVYHIH